MVRTRIHEEPHESTSSCTNHTHDTRITRTTHESTSGHTNPRAAARITRTIHESLVRHESTARIKFLQHESANIRHESTAALFFSFAVKVDDPDEGLQVRPGYFPNQGYKAEDNHPKHPQKREIPASNFVKELGEKIESQLTPAELDLIKDFQRQSAQASFRPAGASTQSAGASSQPQPGPSQPQPGSSQPGPSQQGPSQQGPSQPATPGSSGAAPPGAGLTPPQFPPAASSSETLNQIYQMMGQLQNQIQQYTTSQSRQQEKTQALEQNYPILETPLLIAQGTRLYKQGFRVQCNYCGHRLFSVDAYKLHVISTHQRRGPLRCEGHWCDYTTHDERRMEEHKLTHLLRMKASDSRFYCDKGHKGKIIFFQSKRSLNQHNKAFHTNQSVTPCPHLMADGQPCGKKFSTEYHQKAHETKECPFRPNAVQYTCSKCSKAFNSARNRNRHQREVCKIGQVNHWVKPGEKASKRKLPNLNDPDLPRYDTDVASTEQEEEEEEVPVEEISSSDEEPARKKTKRKK